MKAISHLSGKPSLRFGALAIIAVVGAYGQTLINLATQGRNVDFSNAPSTRPEKTGSSLPATCLAGQLFFNLSSPAGQNLYGCNATNTWVVLGSGSGSGLADPGSNGLVVRTALDTTTAVAAPVGTVVGTTDTQTLTNKTVDGVTPTTFSYLDATSSIQTQLNGKQATLSFAGTGSKTVSAAAAGISGHCVQWTSTGDIGDAGAACGTGTGSGGSGITQLTGDVTTPAGSSGSTVATLATVNSTPGTFGNSTSTPVITVNGKGLITAITTASISGTGGSSTASAISSGPLANLPATCTPAAVYFATDQPAGQQLFTCSSANTWTQTASLGTSGALAYTNGSLDIVTSVVPRLTAANTFIGLNAFSNGLQLTTTTSGQPTCAASTRGLFWYQNNGSSKDSLQLCVFNGTSFGWTALY